jgi:hypothetical protein
LEQIQAMRVPRLLLPIIALSFGFTVAACSGASDPPRVPTELRCDVGGGQTQSCSLTLTAPAGYKITLTSRSCDAINNDISLTSPIVVTLTTDACREPIGKQWDYSTPINPAGTKIDIVFTSDQFANAPGTRVTGAFPNWVVNFEDGGDTDFNDVVLTVEAIPAS